MLLHTPHIRKDLPPRIHPFIHAHSSSDKLLNSILSLLQVNFRNLDFCFVVLKFLLGLHAEKRKREEMRRHKLGN